MERQQQRSLTDLPLEVLDLVYKYCGNLVHKVHLAQVNPILGQAFAFHSRNDFKIIQPGNPFRLDYWRFILPLCGSNVREFSRTLYNAEDHAIKDLVAQHCPNLQGIKLRIYIETIDSAISFIWKIKDALRSVDLCYARDAKIQAKLVQHLPEMPLLKILKLKNIDTHDVYHLQKFVNLEELEFEIYRPLGRKYPPPSQSIPTVNIFTICAPLTKLRLLTVVGVSMAAEDTAVETPLMALEELRVVYCDIAMVFPSCPKLKAMTFKENDIFDRQGPVRRSILKQRESLERLVFVREYTPYDNQGFLELIQRCRKLRFLKLAIRNVKFTQDFVGQIVDVLRKNGLEPNDPLELVIDEYFKFKWLRHWLTFTSGSELLRLRLENIS